MEREGKGSYMYPAEPDQERDGTCLLTYDIGSCLCFALSLLFLHAWKRKLFTNEEDCNMDTQKIPPLSPAVLRISIFYRISEQQDVHLPRMVCPLEKVPTILNPPKQIPPSSPNPLSSTMCIQWLCKHCPPTNHTTLTHPWSLTRCNEYHIARSHNPTLTTCPKGPCSLRRAFHRHPYRGAQRCDACKKAGKNKSKLAQSVRQRANAAIGELPEYTGALFVGELEIPREFYHRNASQWEVRAGEVGWEGRGLADGGLETEELEREWAERLIALGDLGRDGGGWVAPSYGSSIFGRQRLGEEAEEDVSPNPHQQKHQQHHSTSPTCEQNAISRSAPQPVHQNSNPSEKQTLSMTVKQGISRSAHPHVQNYYNNSSDTDTDEGNSTPVRKASRQDIHPHHQLRNDNSSKMGKSNRTNNLEENPTRASHHRKSSLPTRSAATSQATRTRPWDL